MEDCVFCKIAAGDIPSKKVYEDDHVLAFYDLAPQAPVHVLVIPKAHADNLVGAQAMDDRSLAHLLRACSTVAESLGLDKTGFRIVSNCGKDARQSVNHLHIHLLGGAQLSEQMV